MSGLPPFTYIAEVRILGAGTTYGGSIPLFHDGITGLSVQNSWNRDDGGATTLVATVIWEASNDPQAAPGHPDYSSANWTTVTTAFAPSDVTTGTGEAIDNVSNIRHAYVRQGVTYVSGSGLFKSQVSGHGVGG